VRKFRSNRRGLSLASSHERCYCLRAGTAALQCHGSPRQQLRKADCVLTTNKCLTCKVELPTGVHGYCNESCFMKAGRTRRAPGRTTARRRRRRGGRKL